MKFKKAIALALSSLMVFSVFAGCSNSGDSGSSGEKTNISFTSWGDANTTDDVMIQEVAIAVDRFNEENDKNIEITLEVYTSDTYMTKINASLQHYAGCHDAATGPEVPRLCERW